MWDQSRQSLYYPRIKGTDVISMEEYVLKHVFGFCCAKERRVLDAGNRVSHKTLLTGGRQSHRTNDYINECPRHQLNSVSESRGGCERF
jgi:hypothetical protein